MAKGELVLAIFELANCFRHGWGIPKDPIAAKQVSLHSIGDMHGSDCLSRSFSSALAVILFAVTIPVPPFRFLTLAFVVLRDGGQPRRYRYVPWCRVRIGHGRAAATPATAASDQL